MSKNNIKGTSLTLEEIENIINVYLDGIYTYSNIIEIFNLSEGIPSNILNNQELIETYFGEQIFSKIKDKTRIVHNLNSSSNGKELIRNHEVRRIINEDVLYVDKQVKKSLEMVMLFIKYEGNLDILYKNTKVNKNEILNMLHNSSLESLLLPEIISYFKRTLEIETCLFRRDCHSIDKTIERIVYMKKVLRYKEETISKIFGLSVNQINRILVDTYTTIKYKKYSTVEISDEEIKMHKILDIYDIIINNDLSLQAVGNIFYLSKATISNYMNKDLSKISMNKYNNIQMVLNERNTHIITENEIKRINMMKELYDNGYTIDEIGKQFSKDPSTIYRNLVSFYP